MTELNARVGEVTRRIAGRSRDSRRAYLDRIGAAVAKGPTRKRLGCANFAHGFAACAAGDKEALAEIRRGLRARLQASPLMDAKQFTLDFENAMRTMWRTWCENPK